MGKDTRLVNIYIKIHNKRNLTIEDLNYLAKYDPECFEKTCKNVVYNVPDAKQILHPQPGQPNDTKMRAAHQEASQDAPYGAAWQAAGGYPGSGTKQPEEQAHAGGGTKRLGEQAHTEGGTKQPEEQAHAGDGTKQLGGQAHAEDGTKQLGREQMEAALANLKQMEEEGLPVGEIDVNMVKNLLGNLYMEMLFPHTGRAKFFSMEDQEYLSVFNKKA